MGNGRHETRHGRYHDAHAHPSWAVAEITEVTQEDRKDYLGDVVAYERGTWVGGESWTGGFSNLL